MKRKRYSIAVRNDAGAALVALAAAFVFLAGCERSSRTNAPATAPQQIEGETYGGGVSREISVPIAEIRANPRTYEGQQVRVEGAVTDVCPMRGCWFEMAGSAVDEKIVFKVDDGVMEFPMTAIGKHAVAEGVLKVKELSLEETRRYAAHLAEEKGEAFDPATITEPRTLVQLAGTGAVIRDEK